MYTPGSFEESNLETLHEFIRGHSFATLVSGKGASQQASHLPLLLDAAAGDHGTLVGHMARANPQWAEAEGEEVLAIFHGPHAYISPSWYEAANVVPTWNYVAVHAYGVLRLETDRERLEEIIREYVETYESDQTQPWQLDGADPAFIDSLLDAIVGFRVCLHRMEGKWKLNQNHDPARRKKVVDALSALAGDNQQQIAALMADTIARQRPRDE